MEMEEIVKGAATDGVATYLWVFVGAALSPLPSLVASSRVVVVPLGALLSAVLTSVFELVCPLLGGGSYNPSSSAAKLVAGVNRIPILHYVLRLPVQAAAAAVALSSLFRLFPSRGSSRPSSPAAVSVGVAALTKGVLAFFMSVGLLFARVRWRRRVFFRNTLLAVYNALVVLPVSNLLSGSMNPAISFGWAYLSRRFADFNHFFVDWAGPVTGSIVAGFAYRLLKPAARLPRPPPPRRHRLPRAAVAVFPGDELASVLLFPPKAIALPKGGKPLPRAEERVDRASLPLVLRERLVPPRRGVLVFAADDDGMLRRR